jgi:hypothetical protein
MASTYIRVKFTNDTNKKLKAYAESLGIHNPDDFEYHATVIYSPEELNIHHETYSVSDVLTPVKSFYLGTGKWRAYVIGVESNILQTLYNYYCLKIIT